MTTKFVNYTTTGTSYPLAYLTNASINPDAANYSNKFKNTSVRRFEELDDKKREQSIKISDACQGHKACGNPGLNLTTPINLLNISALSEKIQESGNVETQVQSSRKSEISNNVEENLLSADTQTEIKGQYKKQTILIRTLLRISYRCMQSVNAKVPSLIKTFGSRCFIS